MIIQTVHRGVSRSNEASAEIHVAGCADLARVARKSDGWVSKVKDIDTSTDDSILRWACAAWFGPDAYDNHEYPDFRVMPCVKKARS